MSGLVHETIKSSYRIAAKFTTEGSQNQETGWNSVYYDWKTPPGSEVECAVLDS
jgi:hypothetical protein